MIRASDAQLHTFRLHTDRLETKILDTGPNEHSMIGHRTESTHYDWTQNRLDTFRLET